MVQSYGASCQNCSTDRKIFHDYSDKHLWQDAPTMLDAPYLNVETGALFRVGVRVQNIKGLENVT